MVGLLNVGESIGCLSFIQIQFEVRNHRKLLKARRITAVVSLISCVRNLIHLSFLRECLGCTMRINTRALTVPDAPVVWESSEDRESEKRRPVSVSLGTAITPTQSRNYYSYPSHIY